MRQNANVTVFTVSELLRENLQREEGGKVTLTQQHLDQGQMHFWYKSISCQ